MKNLIKQNGLGVLIYILNILVCAALVYLILSNQILPVRTRYLFFGFILLVQILLGILTVKKMKSKIKRRIVTIAAFLILLGTAAASYAVKEGVDSLDTITETKPVEEITFSFVVLKDSKLNDLDDVMKYTVLSPHSLDQDNINSYLEELERTRKVKLKTVDSKDYVNGAKEILSDDKKVLLLNESYRELITEQFPEFTENTRVVSNKRIVKEVKEIVKNVEKKESFVVYISGIDTFGEISSVSRSDVNLLMAVNPNDKKILLVTIPRDSYVPIAGGGMGEKDKLTHAGIYGVSSSIETLENLFGIDINYYIRINFSSLIQLVDVIGGIDIYNEQAFTSLHGKYDFPVGDLHLDGQKALAYSRERYSLKEGDLDRGRNHEKILKAIIEKTLSPSILFNYGNVMEVVMKSSETNMPKSKIIELANEQLENTGKWDIRTTEVTGSAQQGLQSYAMPGWNLYMYVLDEGSVREVSGDIKDAMK